MAHGNGSFPGLVGKLAKIDVLILNDFGLSPHTPAQSADFMELVDDRSLAVTVITSQLPTENWHTTMEDPTLADAILDRLIHNAYKIKLTGESMRKIRGFTAQDPIGISTRSISTTAYRNWMSQVVNFSVIKVRLPGQLLS